jgi:hypothetical protein
MPYLRTILPTFCLFYFVALASAEDKSFYSPVIQVDKDNHRVLISTLGSVFYIEVPVSGLVDFVVEMRGNGQLPLIKTWKVKSGESTCMFFNGKECK